MLGERESLRILEQRRASKAWEQIKSDIFPAPKEGLKEEYRSTVRKAPAMIKTNGLGQTLAFLLAKEGKEAEAARRAPEEAEGFLYKHLDEWLCGPDAPISWPEEVKDKPLMERIMEVETAVYRQASREALVYLGWLKRFAEACFKGKGG